MKSIETAMAPLATSPKVDRKAFVTVACWLGFMIGVFTVAADMGGHIFLFKAAAGRETLLMLIGLTTLWSMVIAFLSMFVYALAHHLITIVTDPRDDNSKFLLDDFEDRCLFWIVVGVCAGYTVLMAVFLPLQVFLVSLVGMVGTIGGFKMVMKCCDQRSTKSTKGDHEHVPLMIV
jgi:hypothetical protein